MSNEADAKVSVTHDGHTDESEANQLIKAMADAFRPTAIGSEALIASELAMAVFSDPINKIRHICEAIMMMSKTSLLNLKVEDPEGIQDYTFWDEMPQVRRVYSLTTAFGQGHQTLKFDESMNEMEIVQLALPFSDDEAFLYLDCWTQKVHYESYILSGTQASKGYERLLIRFNNVLIEINTLFDQGLDPTKELVKSYEELKAQSIYWLMRDGFTVASYRGLRSAFVNYYMPIVLSWGRLIMNTVSPDSFKEALASIGSINRKASGRRGRH